ncbi:response regulator transcription factor [Gammaproteobacteria bacterium]|nr:response regulator transcription factor [Gammaproteobacteria bacterium]
MQKILVIEDDPTIAEALTMALDNHGFDFHWSATGVEGLDYIKNHDVDLLVLDIGLPDITGNDVLRILRQEMNSDLLTLVLTALDGEVEQVLMLEGLGADDYIVKSGPSSSPRVIISKIKNLLKRRVHPEEIDKLENPFKINDALHQILFNGKPLNLTPIECKILRQLVSKPNNTFTRDQLLNIAHERQTGADENTINTHMAAIRKRLKEVAPDNQYIKTIRGMGYSLIL